MAISAKYFITDVNGNFIDWNQSVPGLSILGKEAQVSGGAGADTAFVQAGASADLSAMGPGDDKVYLTGNLGDYTQVIDQDTGIYTFTRISGLLAGQSEVVKITVSNENDLLYFADGHITLNAETNTNLFDGTTFQQLQSAWLTAGGTPAAGPSERGTTTTASNITRVFITDAGGVDLPALPQPGQRMIVSGSAGADSVYVKEGTYVDASNLVGGNDKVYLDGNLADYSQSIDQDTGVYTLTRTTASGLETVKVTISNEDDVLYFADGHIVLNADSDARLVDGTGTFQSLQTAWLTTGGTPGLLSLANSSAGAVINLAESTAAAGVVEVTASAGASVTVTFTGTSGVVTQSLTGTGAAQAVVLSAADVASLGQGPVSTAATTSGSASVNTGGNFTLDTVAPAPSIINAVSTDDIVNASEQTATTISGTNEAGATVALSLGGNIRAATVAGTTWSYALTAADLAAMGEGAETLSVTQTDAAGNVSATGTRAISVDTTAATVSSVALSSATGALNSTLNAGDTVTATVTFSEAVTVTGAPQLALTIGGATVQADYASGSGSTALTFSYTILAAQTDANGIAVALNSLALNGGTITDTAGNNATLTHTAVADNASFMVDTTAPIAPTVTAVATDDIINASEQGVTITGTNEAGATVALSLGGNTRGDGHGHHLELHPHGSRRRRHGRRRGDALRHANRCGG